MTDNSKFWRELDPSTQNYCLENDIKKAEKKMKEANELREESLEEIFDRENYNRLKAMDVKNMSFAEIDHFNEIRKKYANTNKSYEGSALSDIPQAEGAVPNTTEVKAKIINTLNDWIPLGRSRGVTVQQIQAGASLQDILAFCNYFKEALENSQAPVSGIEEPEDWRSYDDEEADELSKKYSKNDLLTTKIKIEKALKKMRG